MSTILRFLLIWFLLEIVAFVMLYKVIGLFGVLLFIVLSSMFGSFLVRFGSRYQSISLGQVWNGKQLSFFQAGVGVRLTLAGVLFLVPGVITSVLGLICLLSLLGKLGDFHRQPPGPHPETSTDSAQAKQAGGRVIEGEFWKEEDKKDK